MKRLIAVSFLLIGLAGALLLCPVSQATAVSETMPQNASAPTMTGSSHKTTHHNTPHHKRRHHHQQGS